MSLMKKNPTREEALAGKGIPTPDRFPDMFTDPVNVTVKLTASTARRHHVPEDYEYVCTCYPHTPLANFAVTMPDGYRWEDWGEHSAERARHADLAFAVSVRLINELGPDHQNRYAEVFPAAFELAQRKLADEKKAGEEYAATRPDTANEPKHVMMVASEPRF